MVVKRTESMIQRAVLEYLEMVSKQVPLYYFRAGSGAFKTQQGRYFKTGKPGVPDVVVCLKDGRFVGFEVKTESGKQSQAQKRAEKDIQWAGGEYYIVRSVDDVRKVVEA
jgi:hypothetical protein